MVVPIWIRALENLMEAQIVAGFLRLEKTFEPTNACPFPTPAHFLKNIESAQADSVEENAEEEWDAALQEIMACYHPDLGWRGPHLSDGIQRAVGAAGGVHYLSQCSSDDLVWAKKRFIEAYLRSKKLEQDSPLLGEGAEIKKLMQGFAAKKAF